jgi:proline dehydrogenase
MTTTVDMESSELTDATLDVVDELRRGTPSVAAVLQAMLRRTEADAHRLGAAGARVRLCKGAYLERPEVAFTRREEVSASYFRSLRALWDSPGTPLVATHDPTLVAYARELAGRAPRPFEFQMLHGVRPDEQRDLAAMGHTVRVYVPYGDEWYPYLMRRLAERPANVRFFLRALSTKR